MATVSKRNWTYKGEPRTAWITRWVDLGGKQRIKTFQTKKLADTYRNTVETEIRQGTHVAESASLTVREGCELWLRECSARVSRGEMTRHTYAFYEVRARLHIVPTLGIQKLSNLTAPMIIKWRKDLAEDTSRPRGQRTIAATVQCLSVMISEMQGLGLIRHNVVKETPLRRKHMRATKRRGKIPTRDEVRAIIAESRGRDRLIYQIAILCGLRKGEIRGLDWRHVDLDEREIRVRQKADKWGDIGPPKSEAGVRDVPIPDALVLAFKEWRMRSLDKSGFVFPAKNGDPLDSKTIDGPWYTLQKRLGWMKDGKHLYRFHDLRHVYASLLIERDLDVKQMTYLLGHSTAAMTLDTYGHLFHDRLEKAHAAVAQIAADIL